MLNILTGIQSTGSALTAERTRMEVVAQNIANANVSNYKNGQPYQRQVVQFDTLLRSQMGFSSQGQLPEALKVARIESDNRPARRVYAPTDPNSKDGYVSLPDINIHEEMVDLIASSHAFEANLAVVKSARSMAMQTLSIGKR